MNAFVPRLVILVALLALGAPSPSAPSASLPGPGEGSIVAQALVRTSATWTASAAGPLVYWQAAAFAPTTCRLVAFGGSAGYTIPDSTWLFDPVAASWTTLARAKGAAWPSVRAHAMMAWHPTLQRIVLFGGANVTTYQDTWAFNPTTRTWTPVITNCKRGVCPPARWGAGMVWSTAIQKLVLFGGTNNGTFELKNDVWTYGTSWVKATTRGTPPPGRFLFGMAEDAATGLIVVYGGAGAPSLTGLNDTWLLDPRTMTWTKVTTSTTPPGHGEVAMGWSPGVGAVVLTGGSDVRALTVPNPGTWAFDMAARNWVQLSTTGGPPSPRKNATLTTDTCHGTAVLFGGETEVMPLSVTDRTWILR